MDLIRWPYRSLMQLYDDRPDQLVWGRWVFTQPDAPPVPWAHPWTSSFLHEDDPLPDGRREVKRRWILDEHSEPPRVYPRPPGQVCGSEEDWQVSLYSQRGSLVVDADGIPLCCGEAVPREGEVDGDASEQATAFGGLQQDGEVDGDASLSTGQLGGLALGWPGE